MRSTRAMVQPHVAVQQLARANQVLVAVPVYNEAQYLPVILPKILAHAGDVLVINDGSTDGTADALGDFEARRLVSAIHHPHNMGYGQSLIDAFAYAAEHGYRWVVTMDCDMQHDPRALRRFFQHCERDSADIISGSRYLATFGTNNEAPADRYQINRMLTTLVNSSLNLRLTDTFCGYKAHKVSAMQQFTLTEAGYAFPMQLWPRAAGAGLRIVEIPVRRIYLDAKRHFGGGLDDADKRLRHYLTVLTGELEQLARQRLEREAAAAICESCSSH